MGAHPPAPLQDNTSVHERNLTMTIIATALFDHAVRNHLAERCKWTLSSETSTLLSACEEASGISHWILKTAMCESVANTLLNDLFDICKADLRQNVTADRFYNREEITDRYGNADTRVSALSVRKPLHDLVTRYLADLRYAREGTLPTDWSGKQARFLAYLMRNFASIEAAYSPESVTQLRQYAERVLVEAGVA
jgi:hypothetical protein